MEDNLTAKQRYDLLARDREPYLERARDCSKLTIPTLVPPDDDVSHERLPTPYQSLGARGVNNLASKLLLALFPPNTPFFKAMLPDSYVEELKAQIAAATQAGDEQQVGDLSQLKTQIEAGLAKIERSVFHRTEMMAARVKMFEALKHLTVAGNFLLRITKNLTLRGYRIDKYVVRRDPSGTAVEMIMKEGVHPSLLPEPVRARLAEKHPDRYGSNKITANTRVDVYTRVYRSQDGSWSAYDEVEDVEVEGTRTKYPEDALPFIPLRMISVDGESYGRSHVEEHLGDLNSLERLMQAKVEAAAIASKVIFMVAPNAVTRSKDLAKCPNGGFVIGREGDVTRLGVDKMQDFSFVETTIRELETRLSFAFLLQTAIQRKGERVTAEEIRYMAGELEDALGGTYSVLSQDLQRPFVAVLMREMERAGELPKLPKDIKIVITTGLEALGRGHDLNRIRMFISDVAQLSEQGMARVNYGNLIERLATAHGIDPEGLIKSEAQYQAEQKAAMQMQMIQSMGPEVIKQTGQAITKSQEAPSA